MYFSTICIAMCYYWLILHIAQVNSTYLSCAYVNIFINIFTKGSKINDYNKYPNKGSQNRFSSLVSTLKILGRHTHGVMSHKCLTVAIISLRTFVRQDNLLKDYKYDKERRN